MFILLMPARKFWCRSVFCHEICFRGNLQETWTCRGL